MNDEAKQYTMPILEEMCKRVGADISVVGWEDDPDHDPNWYWKYQWSKEEEKDFEKWLADYLHANKETWQALYGRRSKTKKNCKDAAHWFVWNHGWRVEEER